MLTYLLYAIFILACLVMIVAIMLQPGKADAGALFTSSVSSTAFGPRGTQTLLAKITIGATAAFMLVALALSLPGVTGPRSVLQSQPAATPTPQPTPPSNATTTTTAPAGATQEQHDGAPANSNGANANSNATTPKTSGHAQKPVSPATNKK